MLGAGGGACVIFVRFTDCDVNDFLCTLFWFLERSLRNLGFLCVWCRMYEFFVSFVSIFMYFLCRGFCTFCVEFFVLFV